MLAAPLDVWLLLVIVLAWPLRQEARAGGEAVRGLACLRLCLRLRLRGLRWTGADGDTERIVGVVLALCELDARDGHVDGARRRDAVRREVRQLGCAGPGRRWTEQAVD